MYFLLYVYWQQSNAWEKPSYFQPIITARENIQRGYQPPPSPRNKIIVVELSQEDFFFLSYKILMLKLPKIEDIM